MRGAFARNLWSEPRRKPEAWYKANKARFVIDETADVNFVLA
jgi:hypothetical protein